MAGSRSTSSLSKAFNHARIQQRTLQLGFRITRNYASGPDSQHLRPLVLEKPDKFRPPSHPSRKPKPRLNFGPALTKEELDAQMTKQYPHTMPPEGSFQYKFLTSRGLHAWIAMSVLFSLAGLTFYMDFHHKNPYPELLPPPSLFWSHPFQYLSQYRQVYILYLQHDTAENMQKRQRKQEEVRKRREYMRAHGIEHEGPYGLGTVEGDQYREKMEEERAFMARKEEERERDADELRAIRQRETGLNHGEDVRAWDGERRKVKKWFGIW